MTNIIVQYVVGPEGTLHLNVPIGIESANVRVLIEPTHKPMTKSEWTAFVQSMAGSITDPTFERSTELPLEARESL